jgi:hypothetical protein
MRIRQQYQKCGRIVTVDTFPSRSFSIYQSDLLILRQGLYLVRSTFAWPSCLGARFPEYPIRGSDMSARSPFATLLALLSPCWFRDLVLSSAEKEGVSGPALFRFAWVRCVQIIEDS